MEIILVIALVVGTVKAAEWGLQQAGKRGKAAASKHWQAHKARTAARPAAPVSRAGHAVGRTLGAGLTGAVHGSRGFASGVRAGFPAGKQQAYDWHDRRQAARSSNTTPSGATIRPFPRPGGTEPRPSGPTVAPRIRQQVASMPSRQTVGSSALAEDPYSPNDRWIMTANWTDPEAARNPIRYPRAAMVYDEDDLHSRIVAGEAMKATGEISDYAAYRLDPADGWDADLGSPGTRQVDPADYLEPDSELEPTSDTKSPDHLATVTPITEGSTDMSITTANRGEVDTFDGLIAELKAIESDAVAEQEDAAGDVQRAKEDAARTEALVSSLAALKVDNQSLNEISALGEAAQARLAAAQARAAAAEKQAATASAAAKGVQSRHGAIQDASDAAGGIAERAFYQH